MGILPTFETARDYLPHPGEYNCYEYYRACTDKYGDFHTFQHMGLDHERSEFLADIDTMSAYFTKELKLRRGDCYGIFLPNCIEGIIAFYALNRLGVIVDFIHPLFPPDALKATLAYTKAKGVMLLDKFAPKYAQVISELNIPSLICSAAVYAIPGGKLSVKPDADSMAVFEKFTDNYACYSQVLAEFTGQTVEGLSLNGNDTAVYMNGGGTTGASRTIMLSSKALSGVVYNMAGQIYPFKGEAGALSKIAVLPFFHAFGLCAAGISTLCNGLKLIPMMRFDAQQYIDLMKKNPMYELVGVPNMFRKLISTPGFEGEHLKHVLYAFSGGDYVPLDFLDKFKEVFSKNGSPAILMPGYGLTEAGAVDCANVPWANKPGTVGQPLADNRVAIFGENMEKLPENEIGEIGITGPTIMQGYLTPDGATGDGLYTDTDGVKWVLTGDLGSLDTEGFVHFAARKKRLIVISGYNVFPADIENLLEPLDFIKETCAVQGKDKDGKPIVRLFAVLADGVDSTKTEEYSNTITRLCAEELTVFSVPREIVYIEALPRTRMEKVDFLKLAQA